MRADADLMVYVAARWPSLVRQAVLLGCPPHEAADAATEALSRCRRDWQGATREADVDRLVQDELAVTVARRPRTPEATRQQAAEELLVLAPPTLDDLGREERLQRRRTLKRAAACAIPLLLVGAGLGAYYATSGAPHDRAPRPGAALAPAAMTMEENPAPGFAWYADGRLHLAHSVLQVDGLRDMTALDTGVVYGDDKGRVVYAADDGSRRLLGHKDPDVPVAATDETGLAAWYDPASKTVDVVEAGTGNVLARTGVGDAPEVVAVDGDVVYLVGADGSRALLPTGRSALAPVSPPGLLDVRARVRAFQLDPRTIQVVQSAFSVTVTLPGVGADLSPDGTVVTTRSPDDGSLLVYDTRDGRRLTVGLPVGQPVLAGASGTRGAMAFVVGGTGSAELWTCPAPNQACAVAAEIPDAERPPVLAR